MSRDVFELRSRWATVGGQTRPGRSYFVTCRECSTEQEFLVTKASGTAPPEVLRKYFTNKGWLLAKVHGHDICPACLKVAKSERAAINATRQHAKELAARKVVREAEASVVSISPKLPSGLSEEDREVALRLLTRWETITTEQAFLQGTVIGAFDRLAALEKEVTGMVPAMNAMKGLATVDLSERLKRYQEEAEMFYKIEAAGTARLTGRAVKLAFSSSGASRYQARVTLTPELARELGFREGAGDRVALHLGSGEDAGLVMVERTKDRRGTIAADIKTSGTVYFVTSMVRPADPAVTTIDTADCKFTIIEGNLVFRLPEAWTQITDTTRRLGAARVAI